MLKMTFAELYKAAIALDPTDDVKVAVEAWRFQHTTDPFHCGPTWTIFSCKLNKHFNGASPEEALDRYRLAVRPPAPQAIEDVNGIEVPAPAEGGAR